MVGVTIASRVRSWCMAALLLLAASAPSHGLILLGEDKPVEDHGWPLGCVEVANLPTRVGWWEGPPFGGGESHFLYRCQSTEEFDQALRTFAAIRTPKCAVVLHDGPRYGLLYQQWDPRTDESQPGADERFDWMFTVWNPESWYRLNSDISTLLARRRPAPAPRLDVYIGGGAIVWNQVVVPDGLQVIDERAESAPVKPLGGGLICGDVFDMSTAKPVAGAEITLIMISEGKQVEQLPRGRTGSLGSFRIERVPKGVYAIAVEAEGYASRRLEESYYNRGNTYYRLAATLVRPASVSGVVTDMDGKPIQGASVNVTDAYGLDGEDYRSADIPARPGKRLPGEIRQAVTDGQGRFEIGALPTGFVQVRCRVPGMHLAKSSAEICKVPGEPVELTMEGTGTVRGKVVDEGGKPPSEQVTVSISSAVGERIGTWGGSSLCAEDGSFAFEEVPPGEYYVTSDLGLLLDGRDPHAARVTVEVGKMIELTIIHGGP